MAAHGPAAPLLEAAPPRPAGASGHGGGRPGKLRERVRALGHHSELVLSYLDQILQSALSLGIAMLFIQRATKAEFGLFTLVNGLVALTVGVQGALILAPLVAIASRLRGKERAELVACVDRLQLGLALGSAAVLALGVVVHARLAGHVTRDDVLLAFGAGLAVVGTWTREFQRSCAFLDGKADQALAGDALYVALVGIGLALQLRMTGALVASVAFALIGGAALVPGMGSWLHRLGACRAARRAEGAGPEAAAPHLRLLLRQGQWTLPGMGIAWVQNTGYAYAVAAMAGNAAVADLAAARLFIMPAKLLMTAWQRVFMPRLGAQLRIWSGGATPAASEAEVACDADSATLLLERSHEGTRRVVAWAVLYVVLLGVFFGLGGKRLLPAKYGGLGTLVLAWCGFLLANAVRTVPSAALLVAGAFRSVFFYSLGACIVSLPLTVLLLAIFGGGGAIHGLTGSEFMLALFSWHVLRGRRGATEPKGS